MSKVKIKKALDEYKECDNQRKKFFKNQEISHLALLRSEEADEKIFQLAAKRYPKMETANESALNLIEVVMNESPKKVTIAEIRNAYFTNMKIIDKIVDIAERMVK